MKFFMIAGGLVLLASVPVWAESEATIPQPETTEAVASDGSPEWLDGYLADELQYDAEQIEQFKQNIADMPEDDLRDVVEAIKAQRMGQAEDRVDINAKDRRLRLQLTRDDRERLADAKSGVVRAEIEDYKKYWNYGKRPRRKYRALFRRQGRRFGFGFFGGR